MSWTGPREVLCPGFRWTITGAGVGLPLLFFVVTLFSDQTHPVATLSLDNRLEPNQVLRTLVRRTTKGPVTWEPTGKSAKWGSPTRTTGESGIVVKLPWNGVANDSVVIRGTDLEARNRSGSVNVVAKDNVTVQHAVVQVRANDSIKGDDSAGQNVVIGIGGDERRDAPTSGPMSTQSYSKEAQDAARSSAGPAKRPATAEENTSAVNSITTTQKISTELPPATRDSSMEALNESGYIVSVVLVLVVGALVGVLATVSHHLHHRRLLPHGTASILHHHHHHYYHHHHHHHHHRHQGPVEASQRHLLSRDHQRLPALPMLSVSPGMEVGSGGHSGLGGGFEGALAGGNAEGVQEAMLAAARDRAVRQDSVRQDLALDLPPRLQLPDGEERPYGAHTTIHLRDPEQESEIYQKCVRPPPNRTVFDSESPPPYRSQSVLLEPPERIVRCHSAGSSLLRVFRKFPSASSTSATITAATTTTTTTPSGASRRLTLSSYSESSSNLSNLSSLTVVPCETDENQQRHQHV